MKKRLIFSLSILAAALTCSAESHMDGGRLVVDGQPFLILGGELGNSSASCFEDVTANFEKLHRMGLNTVLVPMYWDMLEPVEGSYDFSLTEFIIDEAARNDLKVVFLWFGAWKNSMSCYAPLWFKQDSARFPRARTAKGKPMEIASAFSDAVFEADCSAFTNWLRHVKDYDKQGTVIMLQIENEIGMLEDARDFSPLACKEYDKGVPPALIAHLVANEDALHPQLLQRWMDNGKRVTGSWREVFGDDIYSDEYFMAWNYAGYVERLAREARKITTMPLYVNAAMNSRGRKPGEYPSAGPLAHLKDIWHAAAPTLDFLSPDIYDSGFKSWMAQYALPDNTLFVPEVKREDANGVQAYYIFGQHDAIGISPFSIENGSDSPSSPMVMAYARLREIMPLITRWQGTGDIHGVLFDSNDKETVLSHDGMRITVNHYFTLPWDPRATDGSEWPVTGAIIIRLAPDEYVISGTGVVVKFEDENENSATGRLGEDGFIEKGGDSASARKWQSKRRIGLGPVEEIHVNPDGTFSPLRRYNGDETHQGRHVRIGVDSFQTLHVKLYSY